MKELTESINEARRRINIRDRWRSDSWYEDDPNHDYGYESNYHNPYDIHQFPHPRNKECPTIRSEPMSKYQTQLMPGVNDSRDSVRHPSQLTRAVKKKVKPSPFNFSEIPGAPHPMPNDYIKRLPRFSGNNLIEGYLDVF